MNTCAPKSRSREAHIAPSRPFATAASSPAKPGNRTPSSTAKYSLVWDRVRSMWRDIRYALRMLRRSPAFTAVAVASLALGIGANTAIFSLVNALILRMLPVDHPEQLVEFLIQYPGEPALNVFSFRSYQHFRDHNHVFSGVTGVQHRPFHVRAEGLDPQTVVGERVAGNFFSMLGVKPAIGRLLDPGDAANSAVAVVSWSYWRNQRNLDPAIVGSRIVVED